MTRRRITSGQAEHESTIIALADVGVGSGVSGVDAAGSRPEIEGAELGNDMAIDGPETPSGQTESGEPHDRRDRDPQDATDSRPCESMPLPQRVEALLLCSDRPVSDIRIAELLGLLRQGQARGEARESDSQRRSAILAIHGAIDELNARYEQSERTFRIEAVAGGRQILTLPAFGPIVARMRSTRGEGRLSPAALETLAIIAYRQPILRADIESIRGVACGEVLRTLMDRRLVRIVGRSEVIGRPMLYGTTKEFLRAFGLSRIDDLPSAQDGRTI